MSTGEFDPIQMIGRADAADFDVLNIRKGHALSGVDVSVVVSVDRVADDDLTAAVDELNRLADFAGNVFDR